MRFDDKHIHFERDERYLLGIPDEAYPLDTAENLFYMALESYANASEAEAEFVEALMHKLGSIYRQQIETEPEVIEAASANYSAGCPALSADAFVYRQAIRRRRYLPVDS